MDTMQLQPLDARNREIAGALDGIAEELGVTSGQLALAWMMSRDVIPIVGATRAEQLRENLAAAAIKLDDATLKRLDAASAFDAGHPYSMLEWAMTMALGYGGLIHFYDIRLEERRGGYECVSTFRFW